MARLFPAVKTFCTLFLLLYPSAHCLNPERFFSHAQRGANICTTCNDKLFALHKTAGDPANVKNSNGMRKHSAKSEKAYSGGKLNNNDEYKWKVECHELIVKDTVEDSYAIVVIRKIRPRWNLSAQQSVLTRSADNTIVNLPKGDVFSGGSYQDEARWMMKPSQKNGELNWQEGVTFEIQDESNQFLDIDVPDGEKKGALKTSNTRRKWDIICHHTQSGRYDKEVMKDNFKKFKKGGKVSAGISASILGLVALFLPGIGLGVAAYGGAIGAGLWAAIEDEVGVIPANQKIAFEFVPGEYKWMTDKRPRPQ